MSLNTNGRQAERHVVAVVVQIDSAHRKERIGVTRDVSASGTLFLSNSKFEVGERLEVTFHVSEDPGSVRKGHGEVVRVERLEPGRQWRYAMALKFDQPLPQSEDAFFATLEDRS
ncbi:MAG: PilZ domain-containing protein [Myxococcales bacterium]|jgi:hypothetical protein